MSYYSDDEDLDIRIHRGRASPGPVVYPDRYRAPARPIYYQHGGPAYLETSPVIQRSRSIGRRPSDVPPPPPQPVIINNRIYNDERLDDEDNRREYLQLAHRRTHSRHRTPSYGSSRGSSRDRHELEATRRELERVKLKVEREEDAKRLEKELALARRTSRDEYQLASTRCELERIKSRSEHEEEAKHLKKELELEQLRKEREADEEKARIKKESEEAVEKWKRKEAEQKEKEKKEEEETIQRWKQREAEKKEKEEKEEEEAIERWKRKQEKEKEEKEEKEKEYQKRLEEDLRKAGYDDRAIAVVTKKEKVVDPNRPTFTRMSRRHLSIETLNIYKIDYEFDPDPNYVLIRRWVPEYEQDFLWNQTRKIREERTLLYVEGKKKHGETKFEFVREKEHHHKRKPSPSPLLAYIAGVKR